MRTVTILGQHISLVRPKLIRNPIVYESDRPQAKYNTEPRTNEAACGSVRFISLELKDRRIVNLIAKGNTHLSVMKHFNVQPSDVVATGWLLNNGNFVWR